jgi:hypothetical protein
VCNATPRPLYPREPIGTRCIGGWAAFRAGLDGCGKSRLQRDSIPGPASPSTSLYRLSYRGPHTLSNKEENVYFVIVFAPLPSLIILHTFFCRINSIKEKLNRPLAKVQRTSQFNFNVDEKKRLTKITN